MSALEMIVEDLKVLPKKQLEEAANYIHSLKEKSLEERNKILRETAGCMEGEDGEAFAKIIENCERTDVESW